MESSPIVRPVEPLAPYIGGKSRLAEFIIERIEALPHDLYAEPFLGMGGIFFRRRRAAKVEVINDRSDDVATLFRIVQRHYPQFLDVIRFQLTTRTGFERLAAANPESLTDLERAARFLYLQRTAFGGKVEGRSFGVSRLNGARFDLTTVVPMIEETHERLQSVTIECLPWQDFLDRYDSPQTLFYLDPPYWGTEHFYGRDAFARAEFPKLAERLGRLRGRFLLSLNDVPEVRRIFAGMAIEPVETRYTAAGNDNARMVRELLISPEPIVMRQATMEPWFSPADDPT